MADGDDKSILVAGLGNVLLRDDGDLAGGRGGDAGGGAAGAAPGLGLGTHGQCDAELEEDGKMTLRGILWNAKSILVAGLLVGLATAARPTEAPEMRGGAGGETGAVWAASSSVAHVGEGAMFTILNTSNPNSLSPLGSAASLGTAQEVVVSNGYAYVAAGAAGIEVYRITNPSAPSRVSQTGTPGLAQGITLAQGMLALALQREVLVGLVEKRLKRLGVRVGEFERVELARARAHHTADVHAQVLAVVDVARLLDAPGPAPPGLGFALDVAVVGKPDLRVHVAK